MEMTEKLIKKKENNECPFDLVGQKKGSIIILRVSDTKYKRKDNGVQRDRWQYDCICDCDPNTIFQLNRDRLMRKNEDNIQCPKCGRKKVRKPLFESGMKIGHLTLIEQAPHMGKHVCWYCKCDCGNENLVIKTNDFLSQSDKEKIHCGCLSEKEHLVVGNIVNQWEILEIIATPGKKPRFRCKCTCGCDEEKILVGFYDNFCKRRNSIMQKELEEARKRKEILPPPDDAEDLTNKRFGLLKILGFGGEFKSFRYWWAECKCGNQVLARESTIKNNRDYSCGCIKSKGEFRISKFLSENNINYVSQKKFEECRYYSYLPFDFYIENPQNGTWFLLEYQGRQHYEPIKFSKKQSDEKALESLKKLKKRDKIKKDFCEKNNIELLEITYLDFPEIENILAEKLGLDLSDEE